MRILFLADWNSAHVRRWIYFFKDRGHECALCLRGSAAGDGIPVFEIDPLPGIKDGMFAGVVAKCNDQLEKLLFLPESIRRRLYHRAAAQKIKEVVRKFQPELIVVIYAWPNALYISRIPDIKKALLSMGSDILRVDHRWDRMILGKALRHFDILAAPSRQMTAIFKDWKGGGEDVRLCRFGIDLDKVGHYRAGVERKPARVIYSRGFQPVYNAGTAFHGVALAVRELPEIELVVTNPSSDIDGVENLLAIPGLKERIKMMGNIKIGEVYSLMASSRVYLSSSFSDGASTALLEAMWLGCLPVVSDIPSNREWIRHGENGLLFETQSPRSLADCLVRAINDHDLFKRAFSLNQDLIRREGNLLNNMGQLEEAFMKMK